MLNVPRKNFNRTRNIVEVDQFFCKNTRGMGTLIHVNVTLIHVNVTLIHVNVTLIHVNVTLIHVNVTISDKPPTFRL
jgi:hypothetical protein